MGYIYTYIYIVIYIDVKQNFETHLSLDFHRKSKDIENELFKKNAIFKQFSHWLEVLQF